MLALALLHGMAVAADASAARSAAARVLSGGRDSASLATAAALTAMEPLRPKGDAAQSTQTALELAVKASELAPDNPAISWLRLQLCVRAPGCDVRDAATTMRWVDADNGAAWLPTLAVAQKDKDAIEVDRVLASMAQGRRFDLYANRATVMMFDALRRYRNKLPPKYAGSDQGRLAEAVEIAHATVLPSFFALINACRDAVPAERREACLTVSKTLQRADTVAAQLVGFAIERRLIAADGKEQRLIAERRHVLEWREMAANESDGKVLPWRRNAGARARVAKMRALPREEDVCIALLRERRMPLEPPEEHR